MGFLKRDAHLSFKKASRLIATFGVALLLISSFAFGAETISVPPPPTDPTRTPIEDLSSVSVASAQASFQKDLETRSELFFQEFQSNIPKLERKSARLAMQGAIKGIVSAVDFKKLVRRNVSSSAWGVATGYLVDWVIAPTILIHTGHPEWAAALAVMPTGWFYAGISSSVNEALRRNQFRKKFKNVTPKELSKLSDQILGYRAQNRLFSVALQSADETVNDALPAEVVTRLKNQGEMRANAILKLSDLRKIASETPNGKLFLEASAARFGDPLNRATLLLRFLRSDPTAWQKVIAQAENSFARAPSVDAESLKARDKIIQWQNLKLSLNVSWERLEKNTQFLIDALKKNAPDRGRSQRLRLKAMLTEEKRDFSESTQIMELGRFGTLLEEYQSQHPEQEAAADPTIKGFDAAFAPAREGVEKISALADHVAQLAEQTKKNPHNVVDITTDLTERYKDSPHARSFRQKWVDRARAAQQCVLELLHDSGSELH